MHGFKKNTFLFFAALLLPGSPQASFVEVVRAARVEEGAPMPPKAKAGAKAVAKVQAAAKKVGAAKARRLLTADLIGILEDNSVTPYMTAYILEVRQNQQLRPLMFCASGD